MTEKEKFDKSVGVLVKAYLNDTLEHSNCAACAVGNLVADAMGVKIIKPSYGIQCEWEGLGIEHAKWYNFVLFEEREIHHEEAVRQAALIGYTPEQIVRIEYAFEKDIREDNVDIFSLEMNSDEHRYDSLMRVVDVLADIHHVELSDVNEAKAMFVKI